MTLLGKRDVVEHRESEEVPLTWLDHLRLRFAPNWFSGRWPIKYREIVTKTEVLRFSINPEATRSQKNVVVVQKA